MFAHIDGGSGTPFYSAGAGGGLTRQICDLTDRCLISHCSCNYSGATVNCTESIQQQNVWREDKIANQVDRKDALRNAPDKNEQFFKVPKVIK